MSTRAEIQRLVEDRASGRCEYRRMHQSLQGVTFHVEHIVPSSRGGISEPNNLAWACPTRNLHKGPNLSGRDPLTRNVVRLFDPRRQSWKRHFEWRGAVLVGRTQTGRATVTVLGVNDPQRIALRRLLRDEGDWPADDLS